MSVLLKDAASNSLLQPGKMWYNLRHLNCWSHSSMGVPHNGMDIFKWAGFVSQQSYLHCFFTDGLSRKLSAAFLHREL